MTDSEHVALIRRWYSTLDRSLMAPEVVWELAEGFPHGGVYRGQQIFDEFFPRLQADFSQWSAVIDEIIDAGEQVLGLGRYQAQARASGIQVTAPFAHLWTIHQGQILALRQYTDTLLLQRALTGARACP